MKKERTTPRKKDIAKEVGIMPQALSRILRKRTRNFRLAKRLVTASKGTLTLKQLLPEEFADIINE